MDIQDHALKKIETRFWQIVLLAVVVILFLTLGLLVIQFLGVLSETGAIEVSGDAFNYTIFLSILILLFCAYMIVSHRRLLHLSQEFQQQKEVVQMFGNDVQTLSALLEVSSSINSKQKLADILNTIVREIQTCFRADQTSIMLRDKHTDILKTRAYYGEGGELTKDALVPIGKSIAGWVVKNNKPLLLNGHVDPLEFPGAQKKDRVISSAMCVPLKIGETSIGVLNVNLVDSVMKFTDTDLKLITIFANNAAVAIHNAMLLKEQTHRIRVQTMLEQMHSPQVVEELVKKIDGADQPNKMREKLEVTVLFADIRGFSNLVSVLRLEQTMDFLDEFYSVMTKTVFDNQGSIDKFIGDEVMAFFGAPLALTNCSENGLKTALEMLESFKVLRERFAKTSLYFESLGLGIGVNTGEAYVGNVGSIERYDYTVIGNAVNLARRLCAAAEPDEIITTDQTFSQVPGLVSSEFRENISFKGFAEPLSIHKILLP